MARLGRIWRPTFLLVAEEVSMIPAEAFNMGAYRAAWAAAAVGHPYREFLLHTSGASREFALTTAG